MALLLVFGLRAMVPAGYMPVFLFAGSSSTLSVTLCVKGLPGSVIETLALETHHGHIEPQDLDCAFGSAIGHAFLLPPAVIPPLLLGSAPAPLVADLIVDAGPRRILGPPLGSRAPPLTV